MDPDVTRQMPPQKTVLYHCTCGMQIMLDPTLGSTCSQCHRTISTKLLEQDLGITVSLDDASFRLDRTLPFQNVPEFSRPNHGVVHAANDSTPDKLIGEMFGHFKLISPLGRGGMGQVYRALDTSLQRFAAVKLLRSGIESPESPEHPNSDEEVQRSTGVFNPISDERPRSSDREIDLLLQEAVAQARVSHPNIVTIYYVGKQNGNPFLAMELVNGQPLSQLIGEKEMPFDEIVSVALDITHALTFSYDLDIIHGDIKPSNVLLTKSGAAKLSDFGMARSATEDTESSVGGTPNYIAPEVLKGGKPSLQSDIYALGVTLYELSFGELPHKLSGGSISKWNEILDSSELIFPTPWPARLPEQWKNILTKMLDKDPARRFQSYDALLENLKSVEPGSKVPARLLPRLIAAGIDWATVLSLAVVVQVAFNSPSWISIGTSHPAMVTLLKLCNFLPIIGYTVLIYFWRQSIGRNLMHIRVVNQYGMEPSGKKMAIRSAIRMQFPLVLMCRMLFNDPALGSVDIALAGLLVLSMVLLLLDIAFMLVYSLSSSVHDLVVGTHVVLDTRARIPRE